MRFSQRIGKSPIRENLQLSSMDSRLENKLWNSILSDFLNCLDKAYRENSRTESENFYLDVWLNFYGNRIDEIPLDHYDNVDEEKVIFVIRQKFFKYSEWYQKYDLVEFLVKNSYSPNENFIASCNEALKNEGAGYRIIDGLITQITTEEEIVEIEESISNTDKWESVNTHLKTSIEYFSRRESPDFRNSIKESISAVEAICGIIVGNDKASLGQALGKIEKEYKLHGALKDSFRALYGYTSDAGGIRHSLLEDDVAVSFEDAKYMLVSCSAFINYLIAKYES